MEASTAPGPGAEAGLQKSCVMCDVTMSRELCPHLEVAVADRAVAAGAAHVWAQGGAVYRSLEPVGGVVLGIAQYCHNIALLSLATMTIL